MNKHIWLRRHVGLLLSVVLSTGETAINVASRKQLFIDYKFIQSAEGVSLEMNPPVRTGAIHIAPDASWEKNLWIGSYSSVVKENGTVRIWYEVMGRQYEPGSNPDFMGVAYAESTDGVHFKKPVLGLVEFEGSRQNNIVLPADPKLMSIGGGSVMIDENPNCPPEERYKSWQKIYPKKGTGIQGPHRVWVSPDGLHWKLSERLVTGLRAADTQSTWFWDPRINRYVGFTREWVQFANEGQIRAASYNESDDMHTWEKMHIALEPDEADSAAAIRPLVDPSRMTVKRERMIPDAPAVQAASPSGAGANNERPVHGSGTGARRRRRHLWTRALFLTLEAEGVYISLMSDVSSLERYRSRHSRRTARCQPRCPPLPAPRRTETVPRTRTVGRLRLEMDLGAATPHTNGRRTLDLLFRLQPGPLRTGPDPAGKPQPRVISHAVMRLDGFVSADFDYSGGSIITPPLRFQGSRLELNLDTGAGGVGRVEILDEKGAPARRLHHAGSRPTERE